MVPGGVAVPDSLTQVCGLVQAPAQKSRRFEIIIKEVGERLLVLRVERERPLEMFARLDGVSRSREEARSLRAPSIRFSQPIPGIRILRIGGHRFFQSVRSLAELFQTVIALAHQLIGRSGFRRGGLQQAERLSICCALVKFRRALQVWIRRGQGNHAPHCDKAKGSPRFRISSLHPLLALCPPSFPRPVFGLDARTGWRVIENRWIPIRCSNARRVPVRSSPRKNLNAGRSRGL